jgi:hypothetical protein
VEPQLVIAAVAAFVLLVLIFRYVQF